jgi:hypothetical protein
VGCRRCWKFSQFYIDNNKLTKSAGRRKKMATEGREHGQGKDRQQKGKYEMDKELVEIRERMEEIAFRMEQSEIK